MAFLCIAFFLSGLAALIYQVLWFRQLGLVLGNSVQAASIVVTVFMVGLAAGARGWQLLARRFTNLYLGFALLEIGIGLYALITPLLFSLWLRIYAAAGTHLPEPGLSLSLLRAGVGFAILLPPTFLMGASLPFLSEAALTSEARFGSRLGLLYGINTLGGAVGVLLAGFLLIPSLGMAGTLLCGVVTNVLAAACVAIRFRHNGAPKGCVSPHLPSNRAAPEETAGREPAVSAAANAASTRLVRGAAALACASGFLALGFEVVWFRSLVLVFSSTTYSFSTMLSVFLLGIAIGAVVLPLGGRTTNSALWVFALAQIGIAGYTVYCIHAFNRVPYAFLSELATSGLSWRSLLIAKFRIAFWFLLAPAFLFGIDVPLAAAIARNAGSGSGEAVGRVYAWNTVGATVGAAAAGFVLLPIAGIYGALITLSTGCLLTVLVALWFMRGARLIRIGVACVALAAGVFMARQPSPWDPELLVIGPYFSPAGLIRDGQVMLQEKLDGIRIRYLNEGIVATVAVTQHDGGNMLYLSDGKVEADTSASSMSLQRMMGHLPMLLHPNPRRAVNIGLGAGVTLGALSCYPLERLECVEIEPAAKGVAREFGALNNFVMDRSDARIVIDDGRNFLLRAAATYDVITSDPFEPVHSGAGNLYTREHFARARRALRSGGIMAQYLPFYEMADYDFTTIVKTFVTVFPDTLLFYTGDDVVMVGFTGGIAAANIDAVRSKFAVPAVRDSLKDIGIAGPADVLSLFVGDLRVSVKCAPGDRINTDDRPVIEFSAPRHAVTSMKEGNHRALLGLFSDMPAEWRGSPMIQEWGDLGRHREGLRKAAEVCVAVSENDMATASALLSEACALLPDNPVVRNRKVDALAGEAEAYLRAGDRAEGLRKYAELLTRQPDHSMALCVLANTAANNFDLDRANALMVVAREKHATSPAVWVTDAAVQMRAGQPDKAMASLRRAAALDPLRMATWQEFRRIAGALGFHRESAAAAQRVDELERRYVRLCGGW